MELTLSNAGIAPIRSMMMRAMAVRSSRLQDGWRKSVAIGNSGAGTPSNSPPQWVATFPISAFFKKRQQGPHSKPFTVRKLILPATKWKCRNRLNRFRHFHFVAGSINFLMVKGFECGPCCLFLKKAEIGKVATHCGGELDGVPAPLFPIATDFRQPS